MSGISTSRHHADWLSLVEVSGPFVSLPVLLKVFPQGLEPRDAAQAKALRAAYEEWQDNPTAPGRQRAWVLHVLTALLGYPAELIVEGQTLPAGLEANMAELGETLRPDFALVGPTGSETAGQAQLLIASYPAEQALDRPVIGKHWKANPATRMMELLHASGVALGLVTNGEHWMLVFAPRGETTGYASWYGALWLDEPITQRAFHSLLGARRFFGVAADSTLLGLLRESAQDQQEVTDQLGYQVREAVEVLVQAFDTLDQDTNRTLLNGVSEAVLYEAALTVMMRLVFLFSAEERGLLHLGKPLYDDNYAISTLLEQLQEVADQHGEEILERRSDAWARLLATFRAVHAGVHHQDLLMPAYGGSLFDPDRYPFLEGRGMGTKWTATQAEPLAVHNRVALHLLTSLQKLRIKMPGGGPSESRRVSFRALGVEQIGHVYEGLLDHTAVRATEAVVGMRGTRDKETEIPLTTLEAKLRQGQDTLIDFLKDETGRSLSALKRTMNEGSVSNEHKLLIACGHNKELLQRIRPFAGLVREDSFERPVVVLPGSVYVTAGTTRRSTGTHYTPPSLTEPVVQHTLEALVYRGPKEGLPREQWQLKLPKEILDLRVCDMAMGSGAFLVQACRYLAERLTEAWENEEIKHPNEVLATPEGNFSQGAPSERLVPQDAAERLAIARRIVADRCLYGVDINPMAVEMAKLSLWLITLDAKRPFTFLDHAFKWGDSLLGLNSFKQLENFSMRPDGGKQIAFSTMNLWRHVDEAKKKREMLEAMPSDTPEQIGAKMALYAEAEEAVVKLNAAGDVLVALEVKERNGGNYETEREAAADHMMAYWERSGDELRRYADELVNGRRTLHWPLAFPEIMERNGFDAFVGNPPFMKGHLISQRFGYDYRTYLEQVLVGEAAGLADLVSFFFRRSLGLLRSPGVMGLVSTNSISDGDTNRVGLGLVESGSGVITRAVRDMPWPGTAGVVVTVVHAFVGDWEGAFYLDQKQVSAISSQLTEGKTVEVSPLKENAGKAFIGSYPLGEGFMISADEARRWIASDERNSEILREYINGKEFYTFPDQAPRRWIVNFWDWPEHKAKQFSEPYRHIHELVLPVRAKVNRDRRREIWWQYAESQSGLYKAIGHGVSFDSASRGTPVKPLVTVIAKAKTSNTWAFALLDGATIFDQTLAVFAFNDYDKFAILQSSLHEAWAVERGSTLKTDMSYTPSTVFATFAFPTSVQQLSAIGQKYYAFRRELMLARQEGLTKTYNRFNDPAESAVDIAQLRTLHREMDQVVAASYGWNDLDLAHDIHETTQGPRYTISEAARSEVLCRLLDLNHQRHSEEESENITVADRVKPTTKRGGKAKKKAGGRNAIIDLFGLGEEYDER